MEEKRQHLPQEMIRPAPPRRHHGRFGLAILLLISVVSFTFFPSSPPMRWIPFKQPQKSSTCAQEEFTWEKATSKPHLDYKPCFNSFQCALLQLPMDYWNSTTNATIELAVVRRPAAVPVTHPQYGGPVILNPGGPGGSGVNFALIAGEKISKMIDFPAEGKYFDIVSFDPRGVGATRPPVRCYENQLLGQSFTLRVMEEGILGSSDASFGRLWSMAKARGGSCSLDGKGVVDVKRYVNTAFVARDMVELVEALGVWREKEAAMLLNHDCRRERKRVEVPEALKHKKGLEKIQYWGFSYGSYLGLTFAAMFPERVGRLIVDGVVDTYDYRKTLWYDNLIDTEKDLDLLHYHCARVGYPTCALANSTGNTTISDVRNRIANITQSLYHNPLPVISSIAPEIVTYSDVKNTIMMALYSPILGFPAVADGLAQLEKGDGTEWAKVLRFQHQFSCTSTGGPLAPPDPQMTIACTDGDSQSFVDREIFEEHFKKLRKLSPSIGAIWARIRMQCVHFSIRPHYRFTANFSGNTSHPILLIGNTADPVTPLRDAINLAKRYKGAVALTQDSPGHCSLAAPSKCTTGYVRRYFQTGELPPVNKTCGVEAVPFGPGSEEGMRMTAEMKELSSDIAAANRAMYASGGGFFGNGMVPYYL